MTPNLDVDITEHTTEFYKCTLVIGDNRILYIFDVLNAGAVKTMGVFKSTIENLGEVPYGRKPRIKTYRSPGGDLTRVSILQEIE